MTTARQTAAKVAAARKAQDRLNRAEYEAARLSRIRDQACLNAADAEATRADLEDALGLSTRRVSQILQRARAAR